MMSTSLSRRQRGSGEDVACCQKRIRVGHERSGDSLPKEGKAGGVSERKPINTGRNLPVAIAVGVGLGGLVILTLLTVPITFLILVAVIVGLAMLELRHVLATRQINVPLIPVAVGGALMFALAYWQGPRDTLAVLGVTFIAVLAWRLPGGAAGLRP